MTYDNGIQKIYQGMKFKPIFIAVLLLSIGQQAFCQSRESTKEIVYDFSLPVYDISECVSNRLPLHNTKGNREKAEKGLLIISESQNIPSRRKMSYRRQTTLIFPICLRGVIISLPLSEKTKIINAL